MLEITAIYTAIALILIPIYRLQGAVHGYSEVKESVFVCLSAGALIVMLFTGLPMLRSTLDWVFLAFVAYITLSVYWSDSPSLAVKDVPRWWCVFLFYLAAGYVPRETLILAIFMPAPVIAAYGMYQHIMCRDPLDPFVNEVLINHQKSLRFYSFLGNSNYTGSYLVGSIFAGVYCVANVSLWFTPFLALVIVGIAMTRCRGAWLGVVVGFMGVMPELWPFMIALLCALVIVSWKRWETVTARVHFLNVGIMMLKERFMFGWGPNSFRRNLFKTQAFMNQKNPQLLGNLKEKGIIETPLARRMHNDHAEMFVEYGVIGAGLWFVMLGLGMWQAVSSGSWYIAGGILGISINALFFYPIRVIGIGVGFWAFLGASVPNQAEAAFYLPPLYIAMPLTLIVGLLAWEFSVKRILAIAHLFGYHSAGREDNREKGELHIKAALKLDPLNGAIMADFAAFFTRKMPPLALQTVMRSIDQFDGEKIEYSLWVQMGNLAAINGSVEFAQVCFKMAHYLNPSYEKSYKCMDELNKMITNITKGKKAPKPPKGFKDKGGLLVPDGKVVGVG